MEKLIRDVMSTNIHCCSLTATVPEVAQIMTSQDVSSVIVLTPEDYLAGIITRTDLVELRGFDDYWYGLTADHVMKTNVVTCSPDLPIKEASKKLVQQKIHRLVIVEAVEGNPDAWRPVGVISQTDIVRDMAQTTPTTTT